MIERDEVRELIEYMNKIILNHIDSRRTREMDGEELQFIIDLAHAGANKLQNAVKRNSLK